MPLFVLSLTDKPGSLDLRLATRPAHLEWLGAQAGVKLAGPYIGVEGKPVGSMLVIEAADLAAAEAFADADPYAQAGLFAARSITQWNHVLGRLG